MATRSTHDDTPPAGPRPGPTRAHFGSAGFIRRLADLTGPDASAAAQPGLPLVDRLGPWLGWADAISLAAALDGVAPRQDDPDPRRPAADEELAGRCTQVRANLAAAIDAEQPSARPHRPPHADRHAAPATAQDPADFGPWRRHYAARQRTMETAIAPLRLDLRAALAARSPALGRLAELDAVMDNVLGPRERSLLAGVPTRLERRHVQLLRAHGAADAAPAPAWLALFLRDLQDLLRAELDLRMQPVDGLLSALDLEPTASR